MYVISALFILFLFLTAKAKFVFRIHYKVKSVNLTIYNAATVATVAGTTDFSEFRVCKSVHLHTLK